MKILTIFVGTARSLPRLNEADEFYRAYRGRHTRCTGRTDGVYADA
jgi:hypothetical protein